jgi:hypothetical protein
VGFGVVRHPLHVWKGCCTFCSGFYFNKLFHSFQKFVPMTITDICCKVEVPSARRKVGGVLTTIHAAEIYECKLKLGKWTSGDNWKCANSQSKAIAGIHQVSPKTVRGIWNRVTWKYATCHLWSLDPAVKAAACDSIPLSVHPVSGNIHEVCLNIRNSRKLSPN